VYVYVKREGDGSVIKEVGARVLKRGEGQQGGMLDLT
jgi:hypothetical protein